jgi:predicted secreted Zn-dependent protease
MTILLAGNCQDLGVAANSAAEAIVKNYQKRDENYDRKTGRRSSQGVTLP